MAVEIVVAMAAYMETAGHVGGQAAREGLAAESAMAVEMVAAREEARDVVGLMEAEIAVVTKEAMAVETVVAVTVP